MYCWAIAGASPRLNEGGGRHYGKTCNLRSRNFLTNCLSKVSLLQREKTCLNSKCWNKVYFHTFELCILWIYVLTSSARSATLEDTNWAKLTTELMRGLGISWGGHRTFQFGPFGQMFKLGWGQCTKSKIFGGDTAQSFKMSKKQSGGRGLQTFYLRVFG